MKNIHLIKEEYIKCGDCNKHYLCTTCGAQCGSEGHFIEISIQKQHLIDMMKGDEDLGLYEEPKQETLEEAAEKESEVQGWGKYESNSEQYAIKQSFIRGAEWQAERMYSEEDLLNAFEAGMMFIGKDKGSFKEWFEQFKKK